MILITPNSFSASIRRDVSSKFDPTAGDNQVGYFPAVAVSWKASNEKFMEPLKPYINNLKFRVGYGETGNQQIPNYIKTNARAVYRTNQSVCGYHYSKR